jgi:hypothetical protein
VEGNNDDVAYHCLSHAIVAMHGEIETVPRIPQVCARVEADIDDDDLAILLSFLPNSDDGEIKTVPRISQVCSRMEQKPVRDDLHHALPRENHHEYPFHFFLKSVPVQV